MWEHYRGQYEDVLETAVSALEVRDKPQVAAIIPVEEAPIFWEVERTGSEVTMYVPPETEQEAEYGAANILVSVNNVPNVQRAAMPDLERGRNGSPNITVTPAIVRQARRMPVARPDEEYESGSLPSLSYNRPAARERLQASVSRIQDTLTTSFYRQYLKDMSTILETMPEETYRSVDVLQVSSNLLCRLFERSLPEGERRPVWLESVTLSGVQSRAYERSKKVLMGLLSADRYTKERHPPTGHWTLSGRHALIGVDTRSLRDLREDIPNWVINDAASVSDQIVLDHGELEEFLKSPVRKPSRWPFGLGTR